VELGGIPTSFGLWANYGTNVQSRVSHHNSLPLLESLHRLFFLGISNPLFGLIGLPPKNLKGRKKVSKTRWCLLWWNFIFINLVEHYLISCSFLIGWMFIILLILVIFYSCCQCVGMPRMRWGMRKNLDMKEEKDKR